MFESRITIATDYHHGNKSPWQQIVGHILLAKTIKSKVIVTMETILDVVLKNNDDNWLYHHGNLITSPFKRPNRILHNISISFVAKDIGLRQQLCS